MLPISFIMSLLFATIQKKTLNHNPGLHLGSLPKSRLMWRVGPNNADAADLVSQAQTDQLKNDESEYVFFEAKITGFPS